MKQTILSVKQSKLLENLIVKHNQIVTSTQIFTEAKNTRDYKQTKNLITKMVKNGWLIRIKKGLYAISDFGLRGFLSLSPYVVANLLVPDSYISSVILDTIEYSFIKTKTEQYPEGLVDFCIVGKRAKQRVMSLRTLNKQVRH